jgi:hypothetical protein
MPSTYQLAWNLFVQLRQEIIADQRIRITLMGAKITFVSTALAALIAQISDHSELALILIIPAIIAIFFDFSINSMSFAIKRTGFYCRAVLEPELKLYTNWSDDKPLWENYLCHQRTSQRYSIIGNLGLTGISIVAAGYPLWVFYGNWLPFGVSTVAFGVILVLFGYDIYTHNKIRHDFPPNLTCKISNNEVIIA